MAVSNVRALPLTAAQAERVKAGARSAWDVALRDACRYFEGSGVDPEAVGLELAEAFHRIGVSEMDGALGVESVPVEPIEDDELQAMLPGRSLLIACPQCGAEPNVFCLFDRVRVQGVHYARIEERGRQEMEERAEERPL